MRAAHFLTKFYLWSRADNMCIYANYLPSPAKTTDILPKVWMWRSAFIPCATASHHEILYNALPAPLLSQHSIGLPLSFRFLRCYMACHAELVWLFKKGRFENTLMNYILNFFAHSTVKVFYQKVCFLLWLNLAKVDGVGREGVCSLQSYRDASLLPYAPATYSLILI